jgi:hypothetical protein
MQPEVNSFETMEEESSFNQEEINEVPQEVFPTEELKVEEQKTVKPVRPNEVRTPTPPKRHPRNLPKFSQFRKDI